MIYYVVYKALVIFKHAIRNIAEMNVTNYTHIIFLLTGSWKRGIQKKWYCEKPSRTLPQTLCEEWEKLSIY